MFFPKPINQEKEKIKSQREVNLEVFNEMARREEIKVRVITIIVSAVFAAVLMWAAVS